MKNKGFTVIELIVVVILMGILSSIAVFSYRSLFARTRLEETMNQVRAFYGEINRRAVNEGYKYTLQLDRENEELRYISSNASKTDSLVLREELDLVFLGGKNIICLDVHVDGFVKDVDDVREFSVLDAETGKSIIFYISPLGVMEARLQ